MKFNLFFRAKQIISNYINALSYSDNSFEKAEALLKEACPTLLQGKSIIEASHICSTAFDLINYIEWNNGHYLVPFVRIQLTTIHIIYLLSNNKSVPLHKTLTILTAEFLFNSLAQLTHQPNQEQSDAIHLCLCALTSAHREMLNSRGQPTLGPNVRHYHLLEKNRQSARDHKSYYFYPKEKITSKKEHLDIIKEKIRALFQHYDQLILQIEQNNPGVKKRVDSSKIAQFQLEIEKLKYYIIEHQIFVNPRIKASLNRLEQLPPECLRLIKQQQTPPAQLPPLKHKMVYLVK